MQDTSSLSGARPRRSRTTTDGLDRAPHRACLRAMGLLVKDATVVGPAHLGAVTHSGKVNWPYLLPP